MKKFLISAFFVIGAFGFSNVQAQKAAPAQKVSVQPNVKKADAKITAPVVKTETKKAITAAHVPPARVGRVASATTTAHAQPGTVAKVTSAHVKADGTADKRFKENKNATVKPVAGPVKKDGTADMRYKANKKQ